MTILFSFCDCHWLIPWLLPLLIGLAAGWLLWGKYKSAKEALEAEIGGYKTKINGLEEDLAACRSRNAELDGEVAIAKGRMREMEAQLKAALEASVSDSGGGTVVIGSDSGDDNKYKKLRPDNLQVVEGIGPKMDSVLKENGIVSWSELASKSKSDLQAILDKYGDKYRIIDPSTWAQQASLAASGDWDGLIALQKQLDGGKENATGQTDAKVEKLMIKLGIIKKWAQDDLKAIEGIGPKIEGLLKDAGITTWRALADTEVEKIKDILDNAGPRFKLADPGTWPKQAALAADGKWSELEKYQDILLGGK